MTLSLVASASVASLQVQTVWFCATFNRLNNLNIRADVTGMSGPAAPMPCKATDSQGANDTRPQFTNHMLGLPIEPNASKVAIESHNFIDSQILTDGGFSTYTGSTVVSNDTLAINAGANQALDSGPTGYRRPASRLTPTRSTWRRRCSSAWFIRNGWGFWRDVLTNWSGEWLPAQFLIL